MRRRIRKLHRQIKQAGGVDIVLTHAPAQGLGDEDSLAHKGFEALRELLDRYRPQYLVHGHVHLRYTQGAPRTITYENTTIINACERYAFEIPDREYLPEHKNLLFWKGKDMHRHG